MKHSLAPRRAFTLIEILVVIAIIGILSAILFPVLGRARENGRKTACLSNLKQLGLAFQQYTQDTGGKYPLAANFQAWGGGGHWVAGTSGANENLAALAPDAQGDFPYVAGKKANVEGGALFPYVKTTAVYRCPSNRDGQEKGLSYSMNCALSGLGANGKMRAAADIVLLVDEEYATDGYFWAVNSVTAATGTATNSTDKLTTKHNGGGNLLYVDGHAKFFPFNSFPLDESPRGLANKWKTGGSPRFHDRSFGPYGSSFITTGVPPASTDACFSKAGPGNLDGSANLTK